MVETMGKRKVYKHDLRRIAITRLSQRIMDETLVNTTRSHMIALMNTMLTNIYAFDDTSDAYAGIRETLATTARQTLPMIGGAEAPTAGQHQTTRSDLIDLLRHVLYFADYSRIHVLRDLIRDVQVMLNYFSPTDTAATLGSDSSRSSIETHVSDSSRNGGSGDSNRV